MIGYSKKMLETIGWREWIGLPELGVTQIKVKVDTGARTSALHVTNLELSTKGKKTVAHFKIHPNQDISKPVVNGKAEVVEFRKIKSSSGHVTTRPVIMTEIKLGQHCWTAEITSVHRELMGFRMWLGREAVRNRFLVNPGRSFLIGKKKIRKK